MFWSPGNGYELRPDRVRALNALLILHADHEQNCSTSTVRLVGSSQANLYASISAGISALWGPLHGGAHQRVIQMLETIRDDGMNYQKYVDMSKDKESDFRLMGFGHRVYKDFDPRATLLKAAADDVLSELVDDIAEAKTAFNYMFTSFMGLGLIVGIASLDVVSLRAVVERRQQIGVLRAIGSRRRMVQLSFLTESSFVVIMGVAIGVGLGTIISYNIVKEIQEDVETVRFAIPWLQIGIIVAIAYVFSLATTFLPARQASRIYPAEALRYE